MERSLSVRRKCLKRSKAEKKPIKVVYISNPMRVTTSAAMFRAIVQKLTGRDSDVDVATSEFVDDSSTAASVLISSVTTSDSGGPAQMTADPSTGCNVQPYNTLVTPIEMFDEALDAQMLENFCGFMSLPLYFDQQVASCTMNSG